MKASTQDTAKHHFEIEKNGRLWCKRNPKGNAYY